MTPTRQWDVPHSAEYELKNARKHKSGLVTDKGGVQCFVSFKELTEGFGVRSTITTFNRFTPEEPCGGAGKVEFEGLVFLVSWICGLVPHLNRQPHLGRSVTMHHIADVRSAVRYDSGKSGVEIGLANGTGKVSVLSKMVQIGIDLSRRSPALVVGIVEQFLPFRNCLGEDGLLAGN